MDDMQNKRNESKSQPRTVKVHRWLLHAPEGTLQFVIVLSMQLNSISL